MISVSTSSRSIRASSTNVLSVMNRPWSMFGATPCRLRLASSWHCLSRLCSAPSWSHFEHFITSLTSASGLSARDSLLHCEVSRPFSFNRATLIFNDQGSAQHKRDSFHTAATNEDQSTGLETIVRCEDNCLKLTATQTRSHSPCTAGDLVA